MKDQQAEHDEERQKRLLRLRKSARSAVENYTENAMVESLEVANIYMKMDGKAQPFHKQKWVEANMTSLHVKQQ